jgi:hypothetical protein
VASISGPDGYVVHGPTENYAAAPRLILPPGDYSLLAMGANFASVNDEEHSMDGSDHYKIAFWPGPPLPRRVLKPGLQRT